MTLELKDVSSRRNPTATLFSCPLSVEAWVLPWLVLARSATIGPLRITRHVMRCTWTSIPVVFILATRSGFMGYPCEVFVSDYANNYKTYLYTAKAQVIKLELFMLIHFIIK